MSLDGQGRNGMVWNLGEKIVILLQYSGKKDVLLVSNLSSTCNIPRRIRLLTICCALHVKLHHLIRYVYQL